MPHTAPQLALHILFSLAVRRQWRLRTFDVTTAFLSGLEQERELYVRPPSDGLPGVRQGSLLKLVKGVYGLKEAPRLWYLRARQLITRCGWQELSCAKSVFVLRDDDNALCGMMRVHVDDAFYGCVGQVFEKISEAIEEMPEDWKRIYQFFLSF